MVAAAMPSHTNKRLAELAAHFQVDGHDDVFVLSSSTSSLSSFGAVPARQGSSTGNDQANSLFFNTCLALIATSAAILAVHLIIRHFFDAKNHSSGARQEEERKVTSTIPADREIIVTGGVPSSTGRAHKACGEDVHAEQKIASACSSDLPDLMHERPRDPVATITTSDRPPTLTIDQLPRYGSCGGSDLHPRSLVAVAYPRPLKSRVQELVEISNGIDGLNQSTALDVAVRVAQMQSNENMRLMELAFRQNARAQQADQKERHHRETIDEQAKERKWRLRLDARFRSTVDELLSSTSTLGTLLIFAVLCNHIEAVWAEFKVDPLAFTTALICNRTPTETTTSRSPTPMWFVGTWAYEYLQSTKTEMNCGFSIAQYLVAIVVILGIQSFMTGLMGKVLQHACIVAAIAKLSLRLLELEDMLWVAATVAAFLVLSGSGVVGYMILTKKCIVRKGRLPTILEIDEVEDVLDQARLGFIFCKAVAALFLISRIVCLYYWGHTA